VSTNNANIKSMSKGIYTLLIKLDEHRTITIGKRGKILFPAGYYAYIGSALNGLEARIARHLTKEKALHWHIDYFLQKAKIEEIIYSVTEKYEECAIASRLAQKLKPITHFGCSDCRCVSHLYFCKDKHSLRETIKDSCEESSLFPYRMTVAGFKAYLTKGAFSKSERQTVA